MKRVISVVSNNLLTDQRVHKTAETLLLAGFAVHIIGCNKNNTPKPVRNYTLYRFKVWFKKKVWFYAEFNIKLFFILLFSKTDFVLANDLDSLPAAFLASKIRKFNLVYDSHELFTEVPELKTGSFSKNTWLFVEKLILPKLTRCYTVSQSIANYYNTVYRTAFGVVPNFPDIKEPIKQNALRKNEIYTEIEAFKTAGKKIVLYQGAVNVGRGIEACIEAVKLLPNTVFVIIGTGDIWHRLKHEIKEKNIEKIVYMPGAVAFEHLPAITLLADCGVALLENSSLSYQYALPNRVFDYTFANIPFMVSDLPEMAALVNNYKIATICRQFTPEYVADKINELLTNTALRKQLIDQMQLAKQLLAWEVNEPMLLKYFETGLE